MKKLILIFIIVNCLSVLSVLFAQTQKSTIQSNAPQGDTLKKSIKKMTDMERKEMEYLEWQRKSQQLKRSKQTDKNLETIDQQAIHLDSLIIQQPVKSDPKKK
jgi:hypothetical protein